MSYFIKIQDQLFELTTVSLEIKMKANGFRNPKYLKGPFSAGFCSAHGKAGAIFFNFEKTESYNTDVFCKEDDYEDAEENINKIIADYHKNKEEALPIARALSE